MEREAGISASVFSQLQQQGVTRRGFLQFCASMAALLALPARAAKTIEAAL